MWPLLGCSILSLAVIINRIRYYRILVNTQRQLLKRVSKLASEHKLKEASRVCADNKTPGAVILYAGLSKAGSNWSAVSQSMDEALLKVSPQLERHLPVLSTIASVSTLMGFTGTVIGMIRAFNAIAAEGVSSPSVVASGVAEALVTTAFGLFIAIPTIIFYQYFSYRVERFLWEAEQSVRNILGFE